MSRPWLTAEIDPTLDASSNAWAEYSAWEAWFTLEVDDALPDGTDAILDTLDFIQKPSLYALMCRMVDGQFERERPAGESAEASPPRDVADLPGQQRLFGEEE